MDREVRHGGHEGRARHGREEVVLSLASEMLERFDGLRSIVRGASMVPTLFPGDILIVRHETARSARRGDVVLFFREGRFCAHRLVEKREEGGRLFVVTRGDALRKNDAPLAEGELLGRVTAVVRRGKRIELGGPPTARVLVLRWAVRRSDGAVKWLLRWHALRTRLGRSPGGAIAEAQPEIVECA